MGDLNLWGGAPDRADPASEYRQLIAALDAAVAPRRFVDLWLATHPRDPETASGTKPRVLDDGSLRPREKRIDFLLLAGAARATARDAPRLPAERPRGRRRAGGRPLEPRGAVRRDPLARAGRVL